MGGDNVTIVGFYGFPEKGFGAGENRLAVGCGREIVDACSRVDEMVVRS
jgi:hypothetical protein